MSELNVKVGLIGKLDMLKFKNMSKVREKAIQAAPAAEISGDFAINEKAAALHPDYLKLTIDSIISRNSAKTYVLKSADGKALPYFRAGPSLLPLRRDSSIMKICGMQNMSSAWRVVPASRRSSLWPVPCSTGLKTLR